MNIIIFLSTHIRMMHGCLMKFQWVKRSWTNKEWGQKKEQTDGPTDRPKLCFFFFEGGGV